MRTYTKKEYLKVYIHGGVMFGKHPAKPRWIYTSKTLDFLGTCTCNRTLYSPVREDRAYEDCSNCLGFGRQPIPMSELR